MSQNCLITGGPRGIGRATAILAAKQGFDISLVGLRDHHSDSLSVVEEIKAIGRKAVAIDADVMKAGDIESAFDQATKSLGQITGVVNAAGVPYSARVEDFDFASLTKLMAVNVVGLMYCCREAARRMSTKRGGTGGSIVNIASMSGTIGGRPTASAYAASKAAVDVFTTGFAKEVAREGIRVNTIRPGVIDTAMTERLRHDPARRSEIENSIPLGRIGRPEEIGQVAVWLLSEQASFVSGAHVNAGGGGFLVV
jgi:NAD(P)-dependent dehydrogenase (short-subunit alcohol dehydrogenase family)